MDEIALSTPASPLRQTHEIAVRLFSRGPAWYAWDGAALLPGRRAFGWPLMALHASRDLGPVRHALAQRVVSGTMTVHPPILIQAQPDPDGAAESPPNVGEP